MRRSLSVVALLAACTGSGSEPDAPESVTLLDPADQAVRVSMALRGVRPSGAELDAVEADPAALDGLVDAWLDEPAFGNTIRHLHAEALLVRAPGMILPSQGPLTGETQMAMRDALAEEPLALVEDIVMNDQPYTDIVTADYTMTNRLLVQMFSGMTHDGGDAWARSTFTDGRPAAGVLSTNAYWVRHTSNGSNYHRNRANSVAASLLCSDFLERDIPISGDIDLSDDEAVADAVNTQAECVACHQTLDPLASHFWTLRGRTTPAMIANGYASDCARPGNCYPIALYNAAAAPAWRRVGMRAPGYYGLESDDLGTLGEQIAADPRFAQCTVRRFAGYLTQQHPSEVSLETIAPLQTQLVDGGWSAKELAKAIVLSDAFLAAEGDVPVGEPVGLLAARPIQLVTAIEDLTGFRLVINVDNARCSARGQCTGDIDMVMDDALGFRAMAGGIDGVRVTRPTHTTTPTKALFLAMIAEEAASYVVRNDFRADVADRRLFDRIEVTSTDEASVRDQLTGLHRRLYGETVPSDDPQIDEAYDLFAAALGRNGTGAAAVADAWTLTLAGLLQDPRLLLY